MLKGINEWRMSRGRKWSHYSHFEPHRSLGGKGGDTGGVHRFSNFRQMERIIEVNSLREVTKAVVEPRGRAW